MGVPKKFLAAIGAVVFLAASCGHRRSQPDQLSRGGEWLAWSTVERNNYIYGYIDGHGLARANACNAADQLFEVGQTHKLGDKQDPTEVPSGRCLATVDTYSRFTYNGSTVDLSAYANPITEFYTQHPEYRGVPFPFLLENLSDKKCHTANDLFQMALNGKLLVVR